MIPPQTASRDDLGEPVRSCDHVFDPRFDVCTRCGLTAETVRRGRDRPATWDDVDQESRRSFEQGRAFGAAVAAAKAAADRRHAFHLGCRWAFRTIDHWIAGCG